MTGAHRVTYLASLQLLSPQPLSQSVQGCTKWVASEFDLVKMALYSPRQNIEGQGGRHKSRHRYASEFAGERPFNLGILIVLHPHTGNLRFVLLHYILIPRELPEVLFSLYLNYARLLHTKLHCSVIIRLQFRVTRACLLNGC